MEAERWSWDGTCLEFGGEPVTTRAYVRGPYDLADFLNTNNVVPLSAVRGMVTDMLHAVDDKANGWSKAAREAVHEAMGILIRRLGEVPPDVDG